ncbi:MAG: ABC transporter ATP-binding protein [Gammaproteobacteria bacterium]
MSLINLKDIQRVFQVGDEQVHALRDVDLTIGHGEYLSLMGPSGSGKSTLLNMLGLLDRPSAGLYELDGRDTTTLDDVEQAQVRGGKIGFVFQFFHLVPRLTAFENVELPLMLGSVSVAERRERVAAILTETGLTDRMDHRPDQLSGGQRQRVAIARATVTDPELILADEPTGNLDSKSGDEVINILERLNAGGITLIVVTHDMSIGQRAQRRLTMIDGCIADDIRKGSS